LVKWEQYFVAESLVRFSVQTFFAISGFWWARKWNGGIFEGYVTLMAKKWRTLILPYLIWSVLGAFLSLALTGANNLGTHRPFFERSVFAIHGIWPFVDNLFGINKAGPLGDMPLWFSRQLILFFAITPLIALILRKAVLAFVLAFGLIFFARHFPSPPFVFIFPGWLGWFVLGTAIARTDLVERPYSKMAAILSGFTWIAASLVSTIHQVCALQYCAGAQDFVARVIVLSGMIFWWEMTFVLAKRDLPSVAGNLFFVYAFHQFPAQAVISTMHFVFGKGQIETFASFLISPIITFYACNVVYHMVDRIWPRALRFATGGR